MEAHVVDHTGVLAYRAKGLKHQAVEQSRHEHGSNAITPPESEGFWQKLAKNFKEIIIIILVTAVVVELILSLFGFTKWFESLAIAVAVGLATGVAAYFEFKNEGSFRALQDMFSKISCKVFRNNELENVDISDLVTNDLVLLQEGDRIPADGILIYGEIQTLQASLTGEPDNILKLAGPEDYEPANWKAPDDKHLLFRGCPVTEGEGVMLIRRVGDETYLGVLAREMGEAEQPETPLQLKLKKLAEGISKFGYIAAPIIFVAFLFKNIILANNFDWSQIVGFCSNVPQLLNVVVHALVLAVIVVVVAVPEGLPLMIAIVLAQNMKKLIRDNVLVRKILGIETSGSLNMLCVDKTGTVTYGKLMATMFLTGNGRLFSEFRLIPELLRQKLVFTLRHNTQSVINVGNGAPEILGGNPTERAMLQFIAADLASATMQDQAITTSGSIPFSSERKFSATRVNYLPNVGLTLVKGAPEMIFPLCNKRYNEAGNEVEFIDRNSIEQKFNELSHRQIRVVAIATSDQPINGTSLPTEMTLVGVIGIRDEIRPEATRAVQLVQKAGIRVIMITGDRPETAYAIGREIGLLSKPEDLVMTSVDLNRMDDDGVAAVLPKLRIVSRALPTDKSRIVRIAQNTGLVVAMTGDGVNDSPALQAADVGFGMGDGTEVAKEASDVVVLDNNIASIGKAILYGRTIFKSIRKFIVFQLTINVAAVLLTFIGQFIGIDHPLSIVQMLWVNLIMDTLAALAFGAEPPLEQYMTEAPKKRDESLVNKFMWLSILSTGLLVTGMSVFFLTSGWLRSMFATEASFLSGFFTFFVYVNMINAFNARTEHINPLDNIRGNKMFPKIIGLILIVQLALTFFGGTVMRTTPLNGQEWLVVVTMSAFVLPFGLLTKMFARSFFSTASY